MILRDKETRCRESKPCAKALQLGGNRVKAPTQGPEETPQFPQKHREPWEPLIHFPWYLQPAPSLAMSHTLASQETRMSDASGLRS